MDRTKEQWIKAHNHMLEAKEAGCELIGKPGCYINFYLNDVSEVLCRYNNGERTEELFQEMVNFCI